MNRTIKASYLLVNLVVDPKHYVSNVLEQSFSQLSVKMDGFGLPRALKN